MKLIRMLWDSTEAYRAMYYNLPEERAASLESHDEIVRAIREHDADALIGAMDMHRQRALDVLRTLLAER
jgi:DNA-binding GntR family transcriptional regulator